MLSWFDKWLLKIMMSKAVARGHMPIEAAERAFKFWNAKPLHVVSSRPVHRT